MFFLIFLLSVCDSTPDQISNNDQENILKIINEYEDYFYDQNHISDYIYDQNKLHRFDLYLTSDNLNEINNDPAAENYVQGYLVFEGKVLKNVGIRYKGSIGAWVGCLSNEDWTNPSGYKLAQNHL